MRVLLSIMFAFALIIAGCGGGNVAEDVCAKVAECDSLEENGFDSEEDCIESVEAELDALAAEDGCDDVLDAYEDLLSCMAGLSCNELEELDAEEEDGPCAGEMESLVAQLFTAPEACQEAMNCSTTGRSGLSFLAVAGVILFFVGSRRRRV